MEKHSPDQKELQIRKNNCSRTVGIKIPLRVRKNNKKKIKTGDMSVEAITDTIHEYIFEKKNETNNRRNIQKKRKSNKWIE